MRRKDREVTDSSRIDEIISSCECCRLGFVDGASVYIVPLSFGFESGEGGRVLYFHGAAEGRKIELAARTGHAGFEMDCSYLLHEADTACAFSARYQSVIGEGRIELLEQPEQKRRALDIIMRKNSGRDGWSYPDAALAGVAVMKLTVEQLACKQHE